MSLKKVYQLYTEEFPNFKIEFSFISQYLSLQMFRECLFIIAIFACTLLQATENFFCLLYVIRARKIVWLENVHSVKTK